jgi:hypothetical protein
VTDELDNEVDYAEWTVDELDTEITERNERYGRAGNGTLLETGGLKADKVKTLEDDDASNTPPEGGATANNVHELDESAKTGAVRRREARDERLAGEAELYDREHEVTTVQQTGAAADVAEQQAEERG